MSQTPPALYCGKGGAWTACGGTGGGVTLPSTSNLFKGNGSGGALAATPGADYLLPSGNAATATNLSSYPTPCSGGQFSLGISAGSSNCATPSGSGTLIASPKFQIPFYSAAGTASTVTGDSSFTTDGAGNITVKSQTSTGTAGVGGGYSYAEGTPSAGAAGVDIIQANAARHCATVNNNNSGADCVSAVSSSIFYIASSCGGLSNCLKWVDDDSTDNCGSATTAFMAQINSYSGSGEAHVYIEGSGSGKAYKLTSCNLAFTGPSGTGGVAGSVNITSSATIDCAQTGGNCIQMGKTSCATGLPIGISMGLAAMM